MQLAEIIVLCLVMVLLFIGVRYHLLKNDQKIKEKAYQLVVNEQKATIHTLEQEVSDLKHDQEIREKTYQRITKEQKAAIYALEQEISELKNNLVETERKLDFYKNIKEASGTLNEPSRPVQNDYAQLDPEQAAICSEMNDSMASFFITGKAGTGKSFLLDAFRYTTTKSHIVLAPTGIAALNVGGTTLHSAFGFQNLVDLNVDDISIETIRLKSEKQLVLKHVETIIIDEISMVRADTLDKIDRILQVINRNNQPFGGKQLLLFGDLFQLPPIAQPKEREYLYDRYGGVHFFYADAFIQANFKFRELTINHRQKEDAEYFELLNRVRNGTVTSKDISSLNARVVQDSSIYDRFTAILPTKAEVERLNRDHIRQLDSPEYTYHARILYDKYPNKNHTLETLFPIVKELRLKKGALVMMVVNDPERKYVNGTLGIVSELSFDRISVAINNYVYDIAPFEFSEREVTYEDGNLIYESILTVAQFPIVPAYAITIHKAQGQTYKNIVCDINRCFADGQAYVALSRCSSLNGLHLSDSIRPTSIRVDKSILNFYRKHFTKSSGVALEL